MSLSRVLSWIAYIAVALTQFLTGFTLHGLCGFYPHVYAHGLPGQVLPELTLAVLAYYLSAAPIFVGALAGAGFLSLFAYLERGNEQRRRWLPFCLTMAFIFAWMQLATAFLAMTLPLIPIIDGMHAN